MEATVHNKNSLYPLCIPRIYNHHYCKPSYVVVHHLLYFSLFSLLVFFYFYISVLFTACIKRWSLNRPVKYTHQTSTLELGTSRPKQQCHKPQNHILLFPPTNHSGRLKPTKITAIKLTIYIPLNET